MISLSYQILRIFLKEERKSQRIIQQKRLFMERFWRQLFTITDGWVTNASILCLVCRIQFNFIFGMVYHNILILGDQIMETMRSCSMGKINDGPSYPMRPKEELMLTHYVKMKAPNSTILSFWLSAKTNKALTPFRELHCALRFYNQCSSMLIQSWRAVLNAHQYVKPCTANGCKWWMIYAMNARTKVSYSHNCIYWMIYATDERTKIGLLQIWEITENSNATNNFLHMPPSKMVKITLSTDFLKTNEHGAKHFKQ